MIQHVTFEVHPDRIEDCADFYGLLGFERVDPPPTLAERAVWVERERTQVHLMRVEEPAVLPQGHVAVIVEEYERTLERLREHGHDPESRSEHWGSPRAFVRDPGGNRVELMAFPPG